MKTEIICVGTELLEGKLNTNAGYVGERLSSIGLGPTYITTIGDNEDELAGVFKSAIERSSIVIVTGGLGPTFDDLTREGLAKAVGKKLVLNREALSSIAAMFVKRGVEMPKNNERQAYLIEGAELIENPNGTAPGQLLPVEKPDLKGKKNTALIFLLPGPPREMQAMFDHSVMPRVKKYETLIKKSFLLHIFGLGESKVDEKIRKIIEAERKLESGSVSFTILAHQMAVDIKASIKGQDEMLVDEMLHNIKDEFYEVLGDNIFGTDKETIESVVGDLLMKGKKTLAVAESCTGGLLSQKITAVPGSSYYFKQGFVTYSNESKIKQLGIKEETLNKFGAVSEETALEMVKGVRSVSGADFALSITGIAGPKSDNSDKPVGLVYIGISGPGVEKVFQTNFPGSRSEICERSANQALDILRRNLMEMTNKINPKSKKIR
jgi:nicotinamide-nucleotide amidase